MAKKGWACTGLELFKYFKYFTNKGRPGAGAEGSSSVTGGYGWATRGWACIGLELKYSSTSQTSLTGRGRAG